MIIYVCITIGVIIVYSVLSVIIIGYYHRHTASAFNKLNNVNTRLDKVQQYIEYKYEDINAIKKRTVDIRDFVINYNREVIKKLNEIQDKIDAINKLKSIKAKNSSFKIEIDESATKNNKLNVKPKKAISKDLSEANITNLK